MVTPAGKELLRNTIHTAKFHNKILEENDMWRQWEMEKGLTMMVSDDVIRKKRHHRCSYHEKMRKAKLEKSRHRSRNGRDSGSGESTIQAQKWDHSGFAELYPDVAKDSDASKKKAADEHGKRKKIKGDTSADSDFSGVHPSSSDEEVWEEFKTSKRAAYQSSKMHLQESVFKSTSHRKSKKHKRRYHKRKTKKE